MLHVSNGSFELVQQFNHAAETSNVAANAISAYADQL